MSIEGKLLQRISEPYEQVLLIQDGSSVIQAYLDEAIHPSDLMNDQNGSTLRLVGICRLDVKGSWNEGGPSSSTVHYMILIRSAGDVVEIHPPSWWSVSHLVYIAATLFILMLIFFAVTIYDRIKRWKLEAVLQERERMAHAIHDTLAQSFAGIGYQLQAIRRAIPTTLPNVRNQVDLARALVRHSHKEARRSLEPQQETSTDSADLLEMLEASARRMIEGGPLRVSASTTGRLPSSLPMKITDALLHIGQEAIANAVRHAEPSHVSIELVYQPDFVRLTISDDGCGFVESGSLLGFGLRGMRRRSAAISATLNIISSQGLGTRVEVLCPLAHNTTPLSVLMRRVLFRLGDVLYGRKG